MKKELLTIEDYGFIYNLITQHVLSIYKPDKDIVSNCEKLKEKLRNLTNYNNDNMTTEERLNDLEKRLKRIERVNDPRFLYPEYFSDKELAEFNKEE